MTEIEYINTNNNGEQPIESWAKFRVHCDTPERNLSKVKEVVSIISQFNSQDWPTDDKWSDILPQWFVVAIKKNTIDKWINNPILWDYGSWLDALKFREWEWFSSKVSDEAFEIIVVIKSIPYSINPLEYVIFESGVLKDSIYFNEVL